MPLRSEFNRGNYIGSVVNAPPLTEVENILDGLSYSFTPINLINGRFITNMPVIYDN